jgi:hypothetical protein
VETQGGVIIGMKREEISERVIKGKERWLVWVGFIEGEDERGRKIGYYGKFAKDKRGAIGAAKVIIDNTDVYRIIIQDTEPFKRDPSLLQSELTDFFKLEE